MGRTRRLAVLLGAAVASGLAGCAHCDTCDEFPTACASGNCGVAVAAAPMTPTVMDAPMMGAPLTPASAPMAGQEIRLGPVTDHAVGAPVPDSSLIPPPPVPPVPAATTAPAAPTPPAYTPPPAIPAGEAPKI